MIRFQPFRKTRRIALTLVELLVALAVISVLASIALPTAKNTLKGQRLSRAAALVKSAFDEARARSINQSGGGGIAIERSGVDTVLQRSQSIQLRYVVAPPPYYGEAGAPKPFLGINTFATATTNDDVLALWFDAASSQLVRSARDIQSLNEPTLINRGDIVRLGDERLPMRIDTIRFGTAAEWAADFSTVAPVDVTTRVRVQLIRNEINSDYLRFRGNRIAFSISRSPRPAIASPIELPRGTALDLSVSGLGRFGNEFSPMWAEGNYLDTALPPFTNGPLNYDSVYVIFGSRGEVSRVITSLGDGMGNIQLFELPVTGDIHLLVCDAGQVKTLPTEQLEDNDPNPFEDESKDGTTPLLNRETIWVTIRSRNGEVLTTPWIDPTNDSICLVPDRLPFPSPPAPAPANDQYQQDRIRTVIGRTRTDAVDSRATGSL